MFRLLLYPIAIIYGIIIYIRNKMFDFGVLSTYEFDIPVISVGNITVGGTGKTPHIEYLVGLLHGNFKIATLSRGYKRKTRGFLLANENSKCADIGDEPKQIKHKFSSIAVAVMADRVKGINTLCDKFPTLEVVLLDDAFQHRYVKPGLSILLLDYNRPVNEDHYLPYGRLRESMYQMKRANIVIVTKTPEDLKPIEKRIIYKNLKLFPYQNLYFTTIEYGKLTSVLSNEKETIPISEGTKQFDSVLLVTGIANASLLKEYVSERTEKLVHLNYADHHKYTAKEIKKISEVYMKMQGERKIVITTEKDAMRLIENKIEEKLAKRLYYLPMKIKFVHNDADEFNKQIIGYVKKNKRHIKVPKGK